MFKIHEILYWISGLAFGLAIGAYIACPYWKVAVPVMLFISIATGRIGYTKKKEKKE